MLLTQVRCARNTGYKEATARAIGDSTNVGPMSASAISQTAHKASRQRGRAWTAEVRRRVHRRARSSFPEGHRIGHHRRIKGVMEAAWSPLSTSRSRSKPSSMNNPIRFSAQTTRTLETKGRAVTGLIFMGYDNNAGNLLSLDFTDKLDLWDLPRWAANVRRITLMTNPSGTNCRFQLRMLAVSC